MSVRLVVTLNAAPGKGSELARVFRDRCAEVMQEPGCEQFEVFQSVLNPDNWPCSNCGPTKPRSTSMQRSIQRGHRCRKACMLVVGSERTTSTIGSADPHSARQSPQAAVIVLGCHCA